MKKAAIIFLVTLPVLLALDMLWLLGVARSFYVRELGYLMRTTPYLLPVLAFYLLFLLGLMVFAIMPAVERHSLKYAMLYGALFGFFSYMTYDLTNYATIQNWPLGIVYVDMAWGTLLSALVAAYGYFISRFIR